MKALIVLAVLCSAAVAQEPQHQHQSPFAVVPVGPPYYCPWNGPRQQYAVVPTQPGAVVYPRYCYPPPPRGVWGLGPFALGYYW